MKRWIVLRCLTLLSRGCSRSMIRTCKGGRSCEATLQPGINTIKLFYCQHNAVIGSNFDAWVKTQISVGRWDIIYNVYYWYYKFNCFFKQNSTFNLSCSTCDRFGVAWSTFWGKEWSSAFYLLSGNKILTSWNKKVF